MYVYMCIFFASETARRASPQAAASPPAAGCLFTSPGKSQGSRSMCRDKACSTSSSGQARRPGGSNPL